MWIPVKGWTVLLTVLYLMLLPDSLLNAMPLSDIHNSLSELVRIESNPSASFIRIGNDVTYRKYYHYFTGSHLSALLKESMEYLSLGYIDSGLENSSTVADFKALISALIYSLATGYVDYKVAQEASIWISNPLLSSELFFLVMYLMPTLVNNTASFSLGRRLGTEQVIIESQSVRERFYIELHFNPDRQTQVVELRPVPMGLIDIPYDEELMHGIAVHPWIAFHETLIEKGIVSVQLQWYPEETTTGVLARFFNADGQHSDKILKYYHFGDPIHLPVSVESILQRQSSFAGTGPDGSPLKVMTLLHEDILRAIHWLLNWEDAEEIPIKLPDRNLAVELDDERVGYSLDICQIKSCGNRLELLWQMLPYPHYRLKLVLADAEPSSFSLYKNNPLFEQLLDQNLAEQAVRSFETGLILLTQGKQPQDTVLTEFNTDEYIALVTDALIDGPAHTQALAISPTHFSYSQWGRILESVSSDNTGAAFTNACLWLEQNSFDWAAFLSDETVIERYLLAENTGFATNLHSELSQKSLVSAILPLMTLGTGFDHNFRLKLSSDSWVEFLKQQLLVNENLSTLIANQGEDYFKHFLINMVSHMSWQVEHTLSDVYNQLENLFKSLPFGYRIVLLRIVQQSDLSLKSFLVDLFNNDPESIFLALLYSSSDVINSSINELKKFIAAKGEFYNEHSLEWVAHLIAFPVLKEPLNRMLSGRMLLENPTDLLISIRALSRPDYPHADIKNPLSELVLSSLIKLKNHDTVVKTLVKKHDLFQEIMDILIKKKNLYLNKNFATLFPFDYFHYRLTDKHRNPLTSHEIKLLQNLPRDISTSLTSAITEALNAGDPRVELVIKWVALDVSEKAVYDHCSNPDVIHRLEYVMNAVLIRVLQRAANSRDQVVLLPVVRHLGSIDRETARAKVLSNSVLVESDLKWLLETIGSIVSDRKISFNRAVRVLAHLVQYYDLDKSPVLGVLPTSLCDAVIKQLPRHLLAEERGLFLCPVCCHVLFQPVLSHCCNHTLCSSCFVRAVRINKRCPCCATATKSTQTSRNIILRNLMEMRKGFTEF